MKNVSKLLSICKVHTNVDTNYILNRDYILIAIFMLFIRKMFLFFLFFIHGFFLALELAGVRGPKKNKTKKNVPH